MFDQFGRLLITFGILFLVMGGVVTLISKLGNIGKLPGDIFIQRGNVTFFFPLTTSIIISIILSLILTFIIRR
ncbi:DUF2905 domain-containing protein [Natranaerobius thermophilus]|uniref:DUF2905 domain-containing protein n=1 Tax=Natranaerobius thermophilus (strain ATCC BAA-1301 / DSM 18059 / JW/NM-WN-LF) TaxID=457570 RepID=B2A5L3_NATTJ|nr:DUF2905 domain-containing protein [Natranaerobius thermophilus]ACB85367.1 conserved hypothetical protein [Natranaerobius thermophilus JW/NM-WN-LF]